jgi:hypothetical protein
LKYEILVDLKGVGRFENHFEVLGMIAILGREAEALDGAKIGAETAVDDRSSGNIIGTAGKRAFGNDAPAGK